MTKTALYIDFEEAFIKEAVDNGINEDFLRGYLKEADDICDTWNAAFNKCAEESGDPLYLTRLANELIAFTQMHKFADETAAAPTAPAAAPAAGGFDSGLNDFVGNTLHLNGLQDMLKQYLPKAMQDNPDLLNNLVGKGGGGALIGMLLSALTGSSVGMGGMLGGLGGAALGAWNNWDKLKALFNKPTTPPPAGGAKDSAVATPPPIVDKLQHPENTNGSLASIKDPANVGNLTTSVMTPNPVNTPKPSVGFPFAQPSAAPAPAIHGTPQSSTPAPVATPGKL